MEAPNLLRPSDGPLLLQQYRDLDGGGGAPSPLDGSPDGPGGSSGGGYYQPPPAPPASLPAQTPITSGA